MAATAIPDRRALRSGLAHLLISLYPYGVQRLEKLKIGSCRPLVGQTIGPQFRALFIPLQRKSCSD